MRCKSFSAIVTSDIHGELRRFETIAAHIRQQKPALLLDNGDLLQGSFEHMYDTAHERDSQVIALANELGYDAMIFGNHEFNETPQRLHQLRKQATFPWISCNIGDFAQPYIVKMIEDVKVVVIGVTTHFTPNWDEHGYTKGLNFQQAYETLAVQLPRIRQQEEADIVIVSYHGGFAQDPNGTWIFDEGTGENEAEKMLCLPGIDLLITGHQHMQFVGKKNGVSYIQPGSHGTAFAAVTFTYEYGAWQVDAQIVPVVEEAPRKPQVETWLAETIGKAPARLTYNDLQQTMIQGHPYIDWFHQFQRHITGADISVTELFFQEQGGLPQHVTREHIRRCYPRDNVLVTLEMTGAQICAALEQSAAVFATYEDGTLDYAVNVYPNTLQPYQFDFIGGVTFTCQWQQPVGQRITDVQVGAHAMQMDAVYTVAVNSFRAMGHPPFTMYQQANEIKRTVETIPQLLERYIRKSV